MRNIIISVFGILMFLSCSLFKKQTEMGSHGMFKIQKIDSAENNYLIYAVRNDTIVKIVTEKPTKKNNCKDPIIVGGVYFFKIESLVVKEINGKSMFHVNNFVNGISYNGSEVMFESITTERELYRALNLKGLCVVKD